MLDEPWAAARLLPYNGWMLLCRFGYDARRAALDCVGSGGDTLLDLGPAEPRR